MAATLHREHDIKLNRNSAVLVPQCPPRPADTSHAFVALQRASAAALNQLSPPGAPLACGPGVLQQAGAPPSFKPSGLDNLLCYGHYVVHQVRRRRVQEKAGAGTVAGVAVAGTTTFIWVRVPGGS